jgi:hypothetical protein
MLDAARGTYAILPRQLRRDSGGVALFVHEK